MNGRQDILRFEIPKIYPITDRALTGLSHAEQVRRLADGGATLIQIRDKNATGADFYAAAKEAVAIARIAGARIIINDRVDIAMAVKADGVHLGQEDLPPTEARRILGDDAIIGFSTHDLKQLKAAARMPVDYIAFGPVFATSSKTEPDAIVGTERLSEARKAIPDSVLVAIGGINDANIGEVFDAGADSAAIISFILNDPSDITHRVRRLLNG
ncbi:MAG TPA: thiamine phosphate synthase [Pyrinomonadaceae bacterium]|nr:thiamine phosphate synthase [Pyrinomonadaceae bacterium]